MNGRVDDSGRALVAVNIRPDANAAATEVEVWIDTGFTGDLVLPMLLIDALALPQSATIKAILADGSEMMMQTFSCLIDWFDELRELEVIANEGKYPLLGVGLLEGHNLRVSYRSRDIVID
jgi:clan AA aspartic protease